MTSAKRYLAIAASFLLAMVVFSVMAPRAVHAITATLVQVVNTSANPVPTADAETQFQAAVCTAFGPISTSSATNFCGTAINSFVVPTTTSTGATVKRLIVDNFSGTCSNFNSPGIVIKAARLYGTFVPDSVPNGLSLLSNYAPMIGERYQYVNSPSSGAPYTNVPESDYTYGQTTHWAFNPGDTVHLDVWSFSDGSPSNSPDLYCTGKVQGHLITQ